MVGKAELQLKRARKALAGGRYQDASAACLEALQKVPNNADAVLLLGELAYLQDDLQAARDLFVKASELDPTSPAPMVGWAKTLVRAYRLGPARAAAERAAALQPRDAESLYFLGFIFGLTGDDQRSLDFLSRATMLAPRNPTYLIELGIRQQRLGDFDAAERAFRRCIEIDPQFGRAYFVLIEMSKQTPHNNIIPVLEQLFAKPSQDPARTLAFGHALAKSYEDIGDYPASLDALKRAKAVRRRVVRYDLNRDRELFAEAARTFPAPPVAGVPNPSGAPIFVVGMPRSGTTLMDRILSAHPDVSSVGELQTFAVLTHIISGLPSPRALQPEAFRRAVSIDAASLAAGYLNEAMTVAGPARRFVDKQPFNFLFAGLIHRVLPNARIVCLRRDPIDICLSNYRLFFGQASMFHNYAYDLEDIARYYVMFDRLIAHWTATLPADRFMSLQYESLVADQEAETRRLLAFCGLEWDARCLAFHENSRGVATPSIHQVRSPLFTTSIGRWRRYGDQLAPMIEVLRAAGLVNLDE